MYMYLFQDAFSHLALFFYDEHGGESIGVVWKPQAFKIQELKASLEVVVLHFLFTKFASTFQTKSDTCSFNKVSPTLVSDLLSIKNRNMALMNFDIYGKS